MRAGVHGINLICRSQGRCNVWQHLCWRQSAVLLPDRAAGKRFQAALWGGSFMPTANWTGKTPSCFHWHFICLAWLLASKLRLGGCLYGHVQTGPCMQDSSGPDRHSDGKSSLWLAALMATWKPEQLAVCVSRDTVVSLVWERPSRASHCGPLWTQNLGCLCWEPRAISDFPFE